MLVIRLLGPFQVTISGNLVEGFNSDKVRALLAYLASNPHTLHRRESLAALFWPESSKSSARSNLRSSLTNLRRVLGHSQDQPKILQTTSQTVSFKPTGQVFIDVLRFTELVGIESPARSRPQALEEAVELYAGPFLEGLSIIGSTNFDEWVLLQRENLHCLAYTAFCRLTTRYFELGEYEKAAAVSSRQVKLEPWEEEGHRSLMKSLAFIGQRSAALVHYQRFKKSLVQELGVEPSPKTAVCYEKIARGGFEPAGTLHKHQIKQIKNPFKGLRPFQEYDADDFFGREALVEECLHFLDPQEKRSRFLAIVGSS